MSGGTVKAEDAKLPGAGISLKQCPRKCVAESRVNRGILTPQLAIYRVCANQPDHATTSQARLRTSAIAALGARQPCSSSDVYAATILFLTHVSSFG